MTLSLTDLFNIIVIFQCAFFVIFLFSRKKNDQNILLSTLLLSLGLSILDDTLYPDYYLTNPSLAFILSHAILWFGPALFLYFRAILFTDFKVRFRNIALHSVPMILMIVYSFFFYHNQPPDIQISMLRNEVPLYYSGEILIPATVTMQITIYIIITIRELKLYDQALNDHYSKIDDKKVIWLWHFLMGLAGLLVLSTINNLMSPWWTWFQQWGSAILYLSIFAFINWIVYQALSQPKLFDGISEKLVRSGGSTHFDDELKNQYLKKLERTITETKPYLRDKLTLSELSEMSEIPTRDLSMLINRNLAGSFFDYVNRLRIQEASRLFDLDKGREQTIQQVMYASGFNTKSSFNTAFKKYMKVTPKQYREVLSK